MSFALIVIYILIVLTLFAQFGGRLPASRSFVWILVSIFLFVSLLRPQSWQFAADYLGIQLISNFVFAAMLMFLFMELVGLNVSFASQHRKMRDLVSTQAAVQFIERLQNNAMQSDIKVLVVIPCFNEEGAIEKLVSDLEYLRGSSTIGIEYCLVNDGSTDSTWSQMQRFSSGRCVNHLTNINVAGVLLTGFKIARQLDIDFVVQCDGDGQHPVHEIENLVVYALQERADLVVGSRFLQERGDYSSTTRMRLLGSRLIHCVIRVLWRDLKIYDPTSGFRVFSKPAYKVLIEKMPDEYPEPETLAVLRQENLRIVEKSVTMNTREFGTSSISGFKNLQFMLKVLTALFGFRIRGMF